MTGRALDRAFLDRVLAEPRLAGVLALLNQNGDEARVVGGAVRNALLGHKVRDIDIATTALPEETVRRARAAGLKVVPTGIEHGTVTVIAAGEAFEVTTLREDVETNGRHAVVRFGRDFAADALRRDFTINALSVRPGGEICDYAHGLADLAARRVRFIGEARQRIREDYLRILRFFRFSAEYATGPLDPEGLAAAIRERAGLAQLSRERVRAEFLKLLAAPRAVDVVTTAAQAGFLGWITGGVGELGRLDRAGDDPLRRLAALSIVSRDDVPRLREHLRLSNAEETRLHAYAALLERLKARAAPLTPADLRPLLAEHGLEAVLDVLTVTSGEPRPVIEPDFRNELDLFAGGACAVPVLPVRGADFLALGVPKGPVIGRAVAAARREWLDAGCPEGDTEHRRLIAAGMAAIEAV